jgi:hypothetical protein
VSIGCEYVFRLSADGPWGWTGPTPVMMTSAAQLLEEGRSAPGQKPKRDSAVWNPLNAGELRCLVVTDLDTGMAPPPDVLLRVAVNKKKPYLVTGGVRNQLDLNNFLNEITSSVGYKANVALNSEDLAILSKNYKPERLPDRLILLEQACQNRTKPLKDLVGELQTKKVATVWSLAETPAWLGEQCTLAQEAEHRKADRDAWIYTLAELLKIDYDDFYILELD